MGAVELEHHPSVARRMFSMRTQNGEDSGIRGDRIVTPVRCTSNIPQTLWCACPHETNTRRRNLALFALMALQSGRRVVCGFDLLDTSILRCRKQGFEVNALEEHFLNSRRTDETVN
jgi:hypothetical protein